MIFQFANAIRNAPEASVWQLYMSTDRETEGSLFIRLGKTGERLAVSSKNIISLTNCDVGRLLMNGTIIMEHFSDYLQDARTQYPDYEIELSFKEGVVWIRVDGEHLFGYGPTFAIVNAHGDEGWEYYGSPEELRYRVSELFSQAGQGMVITSFVLG